MKRKTLLLILVLSIVTIALIVFLSKNDNEKTLAQSNEMEKDDVIENNSIEEKIIRFDDKGEVNVAIIFNNLVEDDDDNLVFKVYLDTHSVNLDLIDLSKISILRTGDGLTIDKGLIWKKIAGEGHHIIGYLTLPRRYNGMDILKNAEGFIELEINNLGDVKSKLFRWDENTLKAFK